MKRRLVVLVLVVVLLNPYVNSSFKSNWMYMNEVCFLQTGRCDSTFVCCFRSQPSPITSKRIHNIIDYLTYEVWRYSCRGLYEAHKFLFTLLLAFKIDLQTKKVSFFSLCIYDRKFLTLWEPCARLLMLISALFGAEIM